MESSDFGSSSSGSNYDSSPTPDSSPSTYSYEHHTTPDPVLHPHYEPVAPPQIAPELEHYVHAPSHHSVSQEPIVIHNPSSYESPSVKNGPEVWNTLLGVIAEQVLESAPMYDGDVEDREPIQRRRLPSPNQDISKVQKEKPIPQPDYRVRYGKHKQYLSYLTPDDEDLSASSRNWFKKLWDTITSYFDLSKR